MNRKHSPFQGNTSFFIVAGLAGALLLTGCQGLLGPASTPTPPLPTETPLPPTPTPEPMAARVNGEVILLEDYDAEVLRYRSALQELGKEMSNAQIQQAVLTDLVDKTLLAQAARAGGHTLDAAALQQQLADLTAEVGEAQFAEWKQKNGFNDAGLQRALKREDEAAWQRDQVLAAMPKTAEMVHTRQIQLFTEKAANEAYALLERGDNFAALANLYDPQTNGEMGWYPRGYLFHKELEQAAFSLNVGEFSSVIRTEVGYHILYLVEKGEHALSGEALRLFQQQALKQWLEEQRKTANVETFVN
jgi:parvulin-like peptidyl-prolyl isomerase